MPVFPKPYVFPSVHLTHQRIRSRNCVVRPSEGLTEGLMLDDGEVLTDGLSDDDLEVEADGETDDECDGRDGETDIDGDREGLID